jgi:hypothetical protein
VFENAAVGDELVKVSATDLDSGVLGDFELEVLGPDHTCVLVSRFGAHVFAFSHAFSVFEAYVGVWIWATSVRRRLASLVFSFLLGRTCCLVTCCLVTYILSR